MKKIICFNFITIILLFFILEFISYLYIKNDAKDYVERYNGWAKENKKPLLTQRYAPVKIYNQQEHEENLRPIALGDKNKNTILFFGCSYTYGVLLEDSETLPFLVNQKTNMTTVNRGIPGGSILNTAFDLKNDSFYSNVYALPPVEYIIYMFINDHNNRVANPYKGTVSSSINPHYEVNVEFENKDGELVEKKKSKLDLFLYSLYTVKAYHYFYGQKFAQQSNKEKMYDMFVQIKKITDSKFPNSKFVIMLYKDTSFFTMDEDLQKKYVDAGFIVLDAEKLAGHELETDVWRAGDKEHPNMSAFNDVANGLIRELNLK